MLSLRGCGFHVFRGAAEALGTSDKKHTKSVGKSLCLLFFSSALPQTIYPYVVAKAPASLGSGSRAGDVRQALSQKIHTIIKLTAFKVAAVQL